MSLIDKRLQDCVSQLFTDLLILIKYLYEVSRETLGACFQPHLLKKLSREFDCHLIAVGSLVGINFVDTFVAVILVDSKIINFIHNTSPFYFGRRGVAFDLYSFIPLRAQYVKGLYLPILCNRADVR